MLWIGARTNGGYGRFWYQGAVHLVHRLAYEHWVEPIPYGLTIDHVKAQGCTSRLYVAAVHLEAVPNQVNLARGDGAQTTSIRLRPDQTKCASGLHDWVPENLSRNHDGLMCRLCCNLAQARRR